MKKVITVVFVAVAALIAAAVLLAAVLVCIFIFSPPDSMSRVKNVQNVYDEVWNLMSDECRGKKTVLSSATPEAYKDFDPWLQLSIPEHHAGLSHVPNYDGRDKLWIGLYLPMEQEDASTRSVYYIYDADTKLLTGEKDEVYLLENFLKLYFDWMEAGGKRSEYSPESLGEYNFEPIQDHE